MLKSAKFVLVSACLAACGNSGSGNGASPDASQSASGFGEGGAGWQDDAGQAGGPCTSDPECAGFVATLAPSPAGCAEAWCDTVQGQCGVRPVDNDGDSYRTAACAVPGVKFAPGDDCNDDDPNLYPGHSETCSALADGGIATWPEGGITGDCQPGQVSCQADGTESACANEVPSCPSNQTCLSGTCGGECGPQQTQCSGNGVQTCTPTGKWGTVVPCEHKTCIAGSCQGICAPGDTQCPTATTQENCTSTGTWGPSSGCSAACQCATSGTGSSPSPPCAGGCGGVCTPGQQQCIGAGQNNGYQTCTSAGTWNTTNATYCVEQACVLSTSASPATASCQGNCYPGQQGTCVGPSNGCPGTWSCGSNGLYPTSPSMCTVPGPCNCADGAAQNCLYAYGLYKCTGYQVCTGNEWPSGNADCTAGTSNGGGVAPTCAGGNWQGPDSSGACTAGVSTPPMTVTDSSGNPPYLLDIVLPSPAVAEQERSTLENANFVRVDYTSGGCLSGTGPALVITCSDGTVFNVNQSQAGSLSGPQTGVTFLVGDTVTWCQFKQVAGWTSGTICRRTLNLTAGCGKHRPTGANESPAALGPAGRAMRAFRRPVKGHAPRDRRIELVGTLVFHERERWRCLGRMPSV